MVHGTWYRAGSGRRKMHRRLVPLSSRRTAKYRRGGSCEVVCVSRVEGRTGAPARGAPDVATAHKVCACESQPRTLQRRLAPPPAAVDGGVDGRRTAASAQASSTWGRKCRCPDDDHTRSRSSCRKSDSPPAAPQPAARRSLLTLHHQWAAAALEFRLHSKVELTAQLSGAQAAYVCCTLDRRRRLGLMVVCLLA